MSSDNSRFLELPTGWIWAKLGDLISLEYGKGLRKDRRHSEGTVPVYGSNGIVGYHSVALTGGPCLVVGRKGSVGAVHLSRVPCWPIDTTYFIETPTGIDLNFLFHLLSTLSLSALDTSTAIPGLNRNDAYGLSIPLPPLPEQRRIVAKIEELFTRLDAGVEALKKVKAQLKRYRQAVLKHAFAGELTREWREAHKGELEPASALLERIKAQRKKSVIDELPLPNASNLPELPKGWVWAQLRDIAEDVDKVNPKAAPEREFLYLDIASIDNARKRIVAPKRYLGKAAPSRARQLIRTGDTLFSTVRTYLRNIAMVSDIYDGQIASTGFCVIRPLWPIDKKYIFFLTQTDAFLSPLTQTQRGTSYPAVRDSDVLAQPIPLPPLEEQRRMAEEIERRFSIADEIERAVEWDLNQAERLRQSILKRAFEGKLVPQDPSDEPAERLLERIKAEKARRETERKTPKRSKGKPELKQGRLF